ncbi:MAG: metallophosphoesterase [Kiritimatiellae bacterium]|nr:metallophosphoesterase [Kiritimatiellia bacterium]
MATSDLHGNLEGLDPKGADVVVLAGDIAPLRGRGPWHINDQKKWINKRFREWTASCPDIQFVVIPGNHDFYPIAHILFKNPDIDWSFDFSPNVHFEGSRIYNVSRLDERYEIAYEPFQPHNCHSEPKREKR